VVNLKNSPAAKTFENSGKKATVKAYKIGRRKIL